jgi:integrase
VVVRAIECYPNGRSNGHSPLRNACLPRQAGSAFCQGRAECYDLNRKKNASDEAEVIAFLNDLTAEGHVAASTQNQALAAILFLYRHVLHMDLPCLDGLIRAKRTHKAPVVLTPDEVRVVLSGIYGVPRIVAGLLYGSGLRLLEACQLRVKDIDCARRQITLRRGKGAKDRLTILPAATMPLLEEHLRGVREQHRRDLGTAVSMA